MKRGPLFIVLGMILSLIVFSGCSDPTPGVFFLNSHIISDTPISTNRATIYEKPLSGAKKLAVLVYGDTWLESGVIVNNYLEVLGKKKGADKDIKGWCKYDELYAPVLGMQIPKWLSRKKEFAIEEINLEKKNYSFAIELHKGSD